MLPQIITVAGPVLHTFCSHGNFRACHIHHRPSHFIMSRLLRLSKTGLIGFILFFVLVELVPLVDPDYFWHLKTGEYIVTHAALPAGDIFSFTRAGQPWVLHEWLFEALLYGVFAAFGAIGVKALVAALVVATLALAFTAARRASGSAAAAWIPMVVGALAIAVGLAPRPQLLTYLCFAFYLSVLLGFKYAAATRALFVLPVVMVVWVNAHAAYAIGIALLLLFAACEWLAWLVRPVRDAQQKRRLLRLTQASCLTVLASLANPGLFERWLYPFQVLGMAANQFIQEWQSPDFHNIGAQAYLLLVLLFLVANTYAARKPDLTELALPLFFTVQAYVSARHMPLAVLALAPFTALALARGPLAVVGGRVRSSAAARWYMARRGAGKELGKEEFILNWLVAGVLAFCLPLYLHGRQPDPARRMGAEPGAELPRGAADFIEAHGTGGKLFNRYGDGGYLIYRLAPRFMVTIDGRADLYGDRFIKDYIAVYHGGADWRAKFERLGADLAVLPLDAPIRQLLLEDPRFREVYRDKSFSVLQREPSHASAANHPRVP
jgi:hypothetical protein